MDAAGWFLIVLIGFGPEMTPWPGATEVLLARESAHFEVQEKCELARRQLLTRAREREKAFQSDVKNKVAPRHLPPPMIRLAKCVFVPEERSWP